MYVSIGLCQYFRGNTEILAAMRLFDAFLGLAAAGSALAAPGPSFNDFPTPTIKRASKFQFVGVNQAGAEFGNKEFPGTLGKHYTWPVHSTIDVSPFSLSSCQSPRDLTDMDLDSEHQGLQHVQDCLHDVSNISCSG